ncbi:MAG: hypothetical protein IPP57_03765 [Candidatus Obscuribacter sp.]|nr:hypothetical protein [Candidatus Obscuribacter sp.]MDQ5966809.1 hypothetical protein [Cyanobacteriota bacterium erpe_2018_sw_39hr_WHONDRS-SW48-000098_B_bin.30]MBK9202566.1 hypothetical protein [Candidatus Obscuribacter sp.]MBK9622877.1 hypothetical protein [Candidatus Obscuribacter sp.]MBK9769940.1 hypothetical protein [Candidatus Obscuribacter sp.]
MFGIAIIAFELLILYTVFWYVFLREPRPYRITKNLWGHYEGFDGDNSETLARKLHAHARDQKAIAEEWTDKNGTVVRTPMTAGDLIRSHTRGVHKVHECCGTPINLASHVCQKAPANSQSAHAASKFLSKLADRLNSISVKTTD